MIAEPGHFKDALHGLEDVPWHRLEHAYGPAEDVPELLKGLCADDADTREGACHELFGTLWHQGTVYPATAPAVPFLVRIAATSPHPERADIQLDVASGAGTARKMRRAVTRVAGGLLLLCVAGCSPPSGVQIANGLDVTVDVWVEKPGSPAVRLLGEVQPGVGGEYVGTLLSSDAGCEASTRLVAVTPLGKRYTYGPPLCRESFWNISDGAKGSSGTSGSP